MLARIRRAPLIRMVLGPLVWTAHFVAVYALLSIGCVAGWQTLALGGMDLVRLTLLVVTALAVLALLGLLSAYWRARRGSAAWPLPDAVGAGITLLSLIAVVWEGLAVPLVGPCL